MIVAVALLTVLMVMMLMIMVVAVALLAVLMVMMLMIMVVAAAGAVLVMLHVHVDGLAALDDLQHEIGLQIIPRGGDDAAAGMLLLNERTGLFHALGAQVLGAGEDDGIRRLHLIQEELSEVLHIHAALAGVHHGGAAVQVDFVTLGAAVHSGDDVAQLAHAGGLDNQPVGAVLLNQLIHSLLEIAHQRAADAAGVHLGHGDAGVLHEASVDAHLAVLVLQQNNLLLAHLAGEELLDQRGLARAEETGNNVDLDHGSFASFLYTGGS